MKKQDPDANRELKVASLSPEEMAAIGRKQFNNKKKRKILMENLNHSVGRDIQKLFDHLYNTYVFFLGVCVCVYICVGVSQRVNVAK